MSGESRMCYHGVPSILPNSFSLGEVGEEEEAVKRYLSVARININVRQVSKSPGSPESWEEKAGSGASMSMMMSVGH
jgi:hypothetical protein